MPRMLLELPFQVTQPWWRNRGKHSRQEACSEGELIGSHSEHYLGFLAQALDTKKLYSIYSRWLPGSNLSKKCNSDLLVEYCWGTAETSAELFSWY
jgi:hypothetical protein